MEMYELTTILKRKWQTVVLFILLFAGLAFVVSVFQPQKYRAEQRVLLVQSYGAEVDPYAATRSTEFLTGLFTEVAYSEKFIEQVTNAGFGISDEVFPTIAKDRKKFWKKTLRTSEKADKGIIDITIYHENQYTAGQLALAVNHVLTNQHETYHRRGSAVQVETIDPPTTSQTPVEPNIPVNTAAGLGLGLIAGLAFIYLFPQHEVDLVGLKEEHRLVPSFEPDWSQPVAMPVTSNEMQYEVSEVKTPMGAAKAVPPNNLPIA